MSEPSYYQSVMSRPVSACCRICAVEIPNYTLATLLQDEYGYCEACKAKLAKKDKLVPYHKIVKPSK